MPITDLLLPEFDTELQATRNVLAGVPERKDDWKPHEKAMPLGQLARMVAMMAAWVPVVTEHDELDIAPLDGKRAPQPDVHSNADLLALFDKSAKVGREALAKMTDAKFDEPWHFKSGGKTLFTKSRYQSLRWSVLNHIVHHRAQLGTYLRILDQKVPEMYGPTADTKDVGK